MEKEFRAFFWRLFEFLAGACQVRADFARLFFVLARESRDARSGTATITLLHLSVHFFFLKELAMTCGGAPHSCQPRAEVFENSAKSCAAKGQSLLRKRLPPSVIGYNFGRRPFDLKPAPTIPRTKGRSHFYVEARQDFDGDWAAIAFSSECSLRLQRRAPPREPKSRTRLLANFASQSYSRVAAARSVRHLVLEEFRTRNRRNGCSRLHRQRLRSQPRPRFIKGSGRSNGNSAKPQRGLS